MVIATLMAKSSSVDSVAKAAKSRVSSVMKHLPQAPDGSLKRLDLQCTICSYASSIAVANSSSDTSCHIALVFDIEKNQGSGNI